MHGRGLLAREECVLHAAPHYSCHQCKWNESASDLGPGSQGVGPGEFGVTHREYCTPFGSCEYPLDFIEGYENTKWHQFRERMLYLWPLMHL